MSPSLSVDWRNRWGHSWLTQIKDQDCADCYIFAAVGLVEAMIRIEHNLWSLRSEGDVGDSISFLVDHYPKCNGGQPEDVLDWIIQNGIADPGCWETPLKLPRTQDVDIITPDPQTAQGSIPLEVHVSMPTPDRSGRIAKLELNGWQHIGHSPGSSVRDAMKQWIDTIGPIIGSFQCCPDFADRHKDPSPYYPDSWVNSVYICSTDPQNLAQQEGHSILIVGYDDSKQAWLIRNSWGPKWGMAGYAWFGYGQDERGLEHKASIGVLGSAVSPDPWSKRRLHNGNLYEDGSGFLHRNLEVWAQSGNHIRHYSRDGSSLIWSMVATLPALLVNDCAEVPSVLSSTYFRNYEVIYQTNKKELHHLYYDRLANPPTWKNGPPTDKYGFNTGIFGPNDTAGIPAFIQINVGAPGNFEVVVRRTTGELENWYRNNVGGLYSGQWFKKATFGSEIPLSGATLVQRWAKDGNHGVDIPAGLDLVCVNNDHTMQRWWRDDPNTTKWVACEKFGLDQDKPQNIASPPVMICSHFVASDETVPGNYELCVAVNGQIQHWCSSGNPEPTTNLKWYHCSQVFGNNVQQVLGLIYSSFGNLELIALLANGSLQHFWRDSNNAIWNPGPILP
jgi:hypothetical protein